LFGTLIYFYLLSLLDFLECRNVWSEYSIRGELIMVAAIDSCFAMLAALNAKFEWNADPDREWFRYMLASRISLFFVVSVVSVCKQIPLSYSKLAIFCLFSFFAAQTWPLYRSYATPLDSVHANLIDLKQLRSVAVSLDYSFRVPRSAMSLRCSF